MFFAQGTETANGLDVLHFTVPYSAGDVNKISNLGFCMEYEREVSTDRKKYLACASMIAA